MLAANRTVATSRPIPEYSARPVRPSFPGKPPAVKVTTAPVTLRFTTDLLPPVMASTDYPSARPVGASQPLSEAVADASSLRPIIILVRSPSATRRPAAPLRQLDDTTQMDNTSIARAPPTQEYDISAFECQEVTPYFVCFSSDVTFCVWGFAPAPTSGVVKVRASRQIKQLAP